MVESKEHELCKKNTAFIVHGETEKKLPSGKVADVLTSNGTRLEVRCKRNSKGQMQCHVESPGTRGKVDCSTINEVAKFMKEYLS